MSSYVFTEGNKSLVYSWNENKFIPTTKNKKKLKRKTLYGLGEVDFVYVSVVLNW